MKTEEKPLINLSKAKVKSRRSLIGRLDKGNSRKGDFVLMRDQKGEKSRKHEKFDALWLGPYWVENATCTNSFYLSHLDGELLPLPIEYPSGGN